MNERNKKLTIGPKDNIDWATSPHCHTSMFVEGVNVPTVEPKAKQ
jgi:hypothetical protein